MRTGLSVKLWIYTVTVGALLLYAPIDARSEPSQEIIRGAKKEGKLVFYSGIPDSEAKEILDAFEKKYPFIKTTHYRSRGARLITRIQSEYRAGQHLWDVFNSTGLAGYVLLEEGHFAGYASPEQKYYPAGHRNSEERRGSWTTMYTTPMLASYNTQLIPPEKLPNSYVDLLNPMWKGKLGLDPRDVEWYANLRKIWGHDRARTFITGLRKNDIQLREGRLLLTQLLGAGEFAILVNNYYQNITELKEKGAPIGPLPLDPVIEGAGPIGINKHAPHPNAAKVFVDFCLSKESQRLLIKQGRSSARRDVEGNPIDEIKGVKIVPSDIGLGKDFTRYRDEYEKYLGVK